MNIFSRYVSIKDTCSLGGYGTENISTEKSSNELEINGINFVDPSSNLTYEIVALDALYPGDLVWSLNKPETEMILAASHTHYAPHLDSAKKLLGTVAPQALLDYKIAIEIADKQEVFPKKCEIYSANIPVSVYRRFDYPTSRFNDFLSAKFGMYPNEAQNVDQTLRIWVFSENGTVKFVVALFACHPVSRVCKDKISADYVGIIRKKIREKFCCRTVLFFQGCSGDVRPNISEKRVRWLPKNRLNCRFRHKLSYYDVEKFEEHFEKGIQKLTLQSADHLASKCFSITAHTGHLTNNESFSYKKLSVQGIVAFHFLPFEVSHRYHLDTLKHADNDFIVSCSGQSAGYLCHPTQLNARGYEVDGSSESQGVKSVLTLKDKFP
jgi:hypothetical protein